MYEKRKFLLDFYDFHDSELHGMCYFELANGQRCQGWIDEIGEETFEFCDSGPWARKEPWIFVIKDIDTTSFAYWDENGHKWVQYPSVKDVV